MRLNLIRYALTLILLLVLASCQGRAAVVSSTSTPTPLPSTSTTLPAAVPPAATASASDNEWSFATQGEILSSAVLDEGTLYFGSFDGNVYAVDAASGTGRWSFATEGQVVSSPAVAGGVIYVGSLDGYLYALNSSSGQERWRANLEGPIFSSPSAHQGVVYAGSTSGQLYAIEADDGHVRWTFRAAGPVISSPSVVGETIYCGGGNSLYAVNARDGTEKWRFATSQSIQSSPAVNGEFVYVGDDGGTLYAVDRESGEERWRFATGDTIISSPAVADGTVYTGSFDAHLYALDAESGEERWRFESGGPIISSPVVVDSRLYVGSADGSLYALDANSGDVAWRYETREAIWASPLVAGEMVFIGSYDRHFYALRRAGPGLAQLPPPTPLPPQPTPLPTPGPRAGSGDLPWWNDRVFYEIFVRSFYDSDGDGIGDVQGLISKLDYLNDGNPSTDEDLGITGIWLMPVTESPSYHGYDVVDYKRVERDYGSNEDLKQLIAEAHERGIAVIVDLVMNHTSNQHPWFLDAQRPGSSHESWYIWETMPSFCCSPWDTPVWHSVGLRYYYGLFWSGMPDLNYENGEVTAAMYDITRFWLDDMGADGFRLDAVRHLIEDGDVQANTPATHAWLQNFHDFVHTVNPDALTVGEVWDETAAVAPYVGDELDIAFEFDLAQTILQGVQVEDNRRLTAVWSAILQAYPEGQYATFLTNHDQNRVMSVLAKDTEGAKAAAGLLLTGPGVPFLYYGEEVGMRGSKPDERIRAPMQWDDSETAGFTANVPWESLAVDHEFRNVATESADPASLLSHYRTLIHLRNAHPALRTGAMALVESSTDQVFSYLRYSDEEVLLVITNLAEEAVSDYYLSLAGGTIRRVTEATLLLGTGQPGTPVINDAGGFDSYTPLPALPARSTTIIQLGP